MRIKRMRARFGKLNDDTINLGTGLNIIIAPNEGGKTTWSGFIRTMLYGIDYDAPDRQGVLSDKSRFAPWDGSAMEGEMVVDWGEETIVLQRSEKDGLPFAGFSALSEHSGDEVSELISINCGESLIGASEDVFLRSAFIGHGGNLEVNSAPDLERRMASLVSSGQEDVSYAHVDEVLGSWLRRRRHGQNGMIPKLEEELETSMSGRERLSSNQETLTVLRKDEKSLSIQLEKAREEMAVYHKMDQQDVNRRFQTAKEDLEEVDNHHQNLLRQREKFITIPSTADLLDLEENLEEVKALEPQIRQVEQAIRQVEDRLETAMKRGEDDRFPKMTTEEAMRQITTDIEEVETIQKRLDKSRSHVMKSFLVGFAVALCVWLMGTAQDGSSMFALLAGAGFVAISGMGIMFGISTNRRREQRLKETLEFYRVAHIDEMREVGTHYSAIQEEIATLTGQVKQSYQGLDDLRKKQRDSHKKFIDEVIVFAPEANNVKAGGDAISRALRLEEQLQKAEDLLEKRQKIYQELLEKGGEEPVSMEPIDPPETPREELESSLATLEEKYNTVEKELQRILGQQEGLGDLVALSARAERAQTELERRNKEYRAIAIARKGLERAYESVQHRFYPELNRLAGDYFARLTGGKYKTLSLTRELEAFTMIRGEGEEAARSSLALSAGTVDQIYLAVRLAVADLCLAKGELCPIILDDALISFDQVRMEYALDLLAELGDKRQIILFSCHGREGKYMANHPKTKVHAL